MCSASVLTFDFPLTLSPFCYCSTPAIPALLISRALVVVVPKQQMNFIMLISLRRKNLYGAHTTVYSPAYMEDVQKALGALQLVTSTSVLFFLLCNRGPLVYKKMLRSKKKFDISLGLDSLRGPIDAKEFWAGALSSRRSALKRFKSVHAFRHRCSSALFFYFLIWLALRQGGSIVALHIPHRCRFLLGLGPVPTGRIQHWHELRSPCQ